MYRRGEQCLSLIGITTSLISSLINKLVLIYDPTVCAIKMHQFNYAFGAVKAVSEASAKHLKFGILNLIPSDRLG